MSEELERLLNNEANWSAGMYRCAADPRVVVRGRGLTLFTYNFAHARAAWTTLGVTMVVLVVVPLMLVFFGSLMLIVPAECALLLATFFVHDRMASASS